MTHHDPADAGATELAVALLMFGGLPALYYYFPEQRPADDRRGAALAALGWGRLAEPETMGGPAGGRAVTYTAATGALHSPGVFDGVVRMTDEWLQAATEIQAVLQLVHDDPNMGASAFAALSDPRRNATTSVLASDFAVL